MVYEVYEQRGRLWVVLGICVVFVAIGAWLALVSLDTQADSFLAIGIFGIFGVLVLRRLAAPKPVLVLSDAGIADRRWRGAGLISWPEIAAVNVKSGPFRRRLDITLKDRVGFLKHRSAGTRLWWRANNVVSGATYRVSLKGLAVTEADLAERANQYVTPPHV